MSENRDYRTGLAIASVIAGVCVGGFATLFDYLYQWHNWWVIPVAAILAIPAFWILLQLPEPG